MVDRSQVFKTPHWTVTRDSQPDWFRLEEAQLSCRWTLQQQELPQGAYEGDLAQGLDAWLIARGQRHSCVNGHRHSISPRHLDRLPSQTPRRVISICPSNTECIAAIGGGDRLVALDSSSDWPTAIQGLPRLGMDLDVDLDRLQQYEPDLVVASLSVPGMERNVINLLHLGIAVVVLAPTSIDEVFDDMRYLSRILDLQSNAEQAIEPLSRVRNDLAERASGLRPVSTYLEWWPKPLYTPGADCWTHEVAAMAGARWVFQGKVGQSFQVAQKAVIECDPELILVSWCGVPFEKLDPTSVGKREGWQDIAAVKAGHVYAVDEDLLGRPGPRLIEGAACVAQLCDRVRGAS